VKNTWDDNWCDGGEEAAQTVLVEYKVITEKYSSPRKTGANPKSRLNWVRQLCIAIPPITKTKIIQYDNDIGPTSIRGD